MRLERIQELIKNEQNEFKIKYGLKLTLQMIAYISGIPRGTLANLKNIQDPSLRVYYKRIKSVDFSKYINKKFLKSN